MSTPEIGTLIGCTIGGLFACWLISFFIVSHFASKQFNKHKKEFDENREKHFRSYENKIGNRKKLF